MHESDGEQACRYVPVDLPIRLTSLSFFMLVLKVLNESPEFWPRRFATSPLLSFLQQRSLSLKF